MKPLIQLDGPHFPRRPRLRRTARAVAFIAAVGSCIAIGWHMPVLIAWVKGGL